MTLMRHDTLPVPEEGIPAGGISSFGLHLLAMGAMLCDHLWATVLPQYDVLDWIGRLAFPIFAFLAAEGAVHTHNMRRYLRRLLIFALLSEVPFDLMSSGVPFWPFHQNVLWTFLLALLAICAIRRIQSLGRPWLTGLSVCAIAFVSYEVGFLTMCDYFGPGILTVLLFWLFRGRSWPRRLGQLLGLIVVNGCLLGGMTVPVVLGGLSFELPQQATAVLALLPIWCHQGRQGPHGPAVQYACYAFYPVHLLVLACLALSR